MAGMERSRSQQSGFGAAATAGGRRGTSEIGRGPGGLAGTGGSSAVRLPAVDLIKFGDADFQADTFVHTILTQNGEDGVRGYHQSLTDAKDAAAADLQRNVYKNYNEFVVISKEISKLESDMLLIRRWLNELKDVNEHLRPREEVAAERQIDDVNLDEDGDKATTTSEQKTTAPLLALAKQGLSEEYNRARREQMQSLYDNVEGLQKALPDSPNHFLVRDGSKSRCWEVNPATNKQKQPVSFYLLSEALVVATRKKSIITGKSRMVVDKCWGLMDLAVIDVKDSVDVSNAFRVMKHPDVFLYRSETLEEKRGLLSAIKRITDDLMRQKRKDVENAAARQNTISSDRC
ncbi:exocyst complex component exo84 [Borealophlyctis nickersoniae]|nr:exocyst complex component exo84 [Borealophlyctis nickersoniae]